MRCGESCAPRTRVLELGYLSSEFRGTITWADAPERACRRSTRISSSSSSATNGTAAQPEFLTLDRRSQRRRLLRHRHHAVGPVPLFHQRSGAGHRLPAPNAAAQVRAERQGRHQHHRRKALRIAGARRGARRDGRDRACAARFVMMLADEERGAIGCTSKPIAGPKPDATELAQRVDAKLRSSTSNTSQARKRTARRIERGVARCRHRRGLQAVLREARDSARGSSRSSRSRIAESSSFDLDACAWKAAEPMKLESIRASVLTIPFNAAFKHASAERAATQTLWVEARTADGMIGYGEGCPREYVTGRELCKALRVSSQSMSTTWLQRCARSRYAGRWVRATRPKSIAILPRGPQSNSRCSICSARRKGVSVEVVLGLARACRQFPLHGRARRLSAASVRGATGAAI